MKIVAALYSDHYGEAPLCNTAEVVALAKVVNIVCNKFVLLTQRNLYAFPLRVGVGVGSYLTAREIIVSLFLCNTLFSPLPAEEKLSQPNSLQLSFLPVREDSLFF